MEHSPKYEKSIQLTDATHKRLLHLAFVKGWPIEKVLEILVAEEWVKSLDQKQFTGRGSKMLGERG